jgi:hypothetical protein
MVVRWCFARYFPGPQLFWLFLGITILNPDSPGKSYLQGGAAYSTRVYYRYIHTCLLNYNLLHSGPALQPTCQKYVGTTFERPGGWVSRLHFIALLHVWHFVPCARTARQPFHHFLAEEGAISGRSWPGCRTKRVICYTMFWINMILWCYDIVITRTHMYIYIYCQKLRAIVFWWLINR